VARVSPSVRRVQQLDIPAAALRGLFGLFRERLEIRTNDARVLAAAEVAFGRFKVPAGGVPLVAKIVVETDPRGAPGHAADARDLVHDTAGHLLTINLPGALRAVVDGAAGFATAVISEELAAEPRLLRYAVVEAMALAMLTGGRGYVPIHASCVVREGRGVILQAPAGTGKSTLALACANRGWGLLAEDVVFARPGEGPGASELEVWGVPWTQRLLPDAPRFFPELAAATPRLQANGEHKLEVDLDVHAPGRATPRALAGPMVLLARDTGGPTRGEWLDPADDAVEVEVLWAWEAGWTAAHQRTAQRLLDHGLLRLHLNSTPDEAVDALEDALAGRSRTSAGPLTPHGPRRARSEP
jgi:hypothetical protein